MRFNFKHQRAGVSDFFPDKESVNPFNFLKRIILVNSEDADEMLPNISFISDIPLFLQKT